MICLYPFCLLYKTRLFALDSEHFSIQNFFDNKVNLKQDKIYNIFLTASGGPFLGKVYNDIKKASFNIYKRGLASLAPFMF